MFGMSNNRRIRQAASTVFRIVRLGPGLVHGDGGLLLTAGRICDRRPSNIYFYIVSNLLVDLYVKKDRSLDIRSVHEIMECTESWTIST